jgi:hypothetical protein
MPKQALELENLAEEETNAALRELDRNLGIVSGPPSLIPNRPTNPTPIEAGETAVVSDKPERRLGRRAAKAGLAASLIGLLTTAILTFGPRVVESLQAPPAPPGATATVTPDATTYATQDALDALALRVAKVAKCEQDPEVPPAPGTTCARLLCLERQMRLDAKALAAMNGGRFGPGWEGDAGLFEPDDQPPPMISTKEIWPCAKEAD